MIDFIVENYQFIALVGAGLIDVILLIVALCSKKEKPILNLISDMLPGFIKDAEVAIGSGNGEQKMEYVLSRIEEEYKKQTGCVLHLRGYLYRSFRNRIEDILGTPQKKGK